MENRPDLKLANALSRGEAIALRNAAHQALEAMAHFGSGEAYMRIIADLMVVAYREDAQAFKVSEIVKPATLSGASDDAPAGQRAPRSGGSLA